MGCLRCFLPVNPSYSVKFSEDDGEEAGKAATRRQWRSGRKIHQDLSAAVLQGGKETAE